jgi:hypothetical protein
MITPKADFLLNKNRVQKARGILEGEEFQDLIRDALLQFLMDKANSNDAQQAVRNQYQAEGAKLFAGELLNFVNAPSTSIKRPINDLIPT